MRWSEEESENDMKINEDQSDYDVDGLEQSQSPSFILFSLLLSLSRVASKIFHCCCVCEQCKKFDSTKLNWLEPFAVTFCYFYDEEEFTVVDYFKTEGTLPCIHRTSWNVK